jgi:acyl-CoA thioester hydrolase
MGIVKKIRNKVKDRGIFLLFIFRLNVEGLKQLCQDMQMFKFQRRVHVYETDLMGIVHHSNYIRFCEEARVQFFVENKMLDTSNKAVFSLTVVDLEFKYLKPLRYGDGFQIQLQFKAQGARLLIQYKILNLENQICVVAQTTHCSLDEKFKVLRLDQNMIQKILDYNNENSKELSWTETWL